MQVRQPSLLSCKRTESDKKAILGRVDQAAEQMSSQKNEFYKILLTSRVISSSTILFCLGTRPVLLPELMHRAPVSVIELAPTVGSGELICSGSMAYSYSSATLRTVDSGVTRKKVRRQTCGKEVSICWGAKMVSFTVNDK